MQSLASLYNKFLPSLDNPISKNLVAKDTVIMISIWWKSLQVGEFHLRVFIFQLLELQLYPRILCGLVFEGIVINIFIRWDFPQAGEFHHKVINMLWACLWPGGQGYTYQWLHMSRFSAGWRISFHYFNHILIRWLEVKEYAPTVSCFRILDGLEYHTSETIIV